MKYCENHDFMEKCEIHVKSTRKQPSAPEAENSSNSYAFYMVRRPFGCFWSQNGGIHGISHILAEFHPFWWNGVKFGDFWCLGDGNLAFTRSSMKTWSILGLFRCFSRPDRYFSLNSTYFRWFSVKSPKWWKFGVWGGKCYFWGKRGGNSINFA